MANDAQQHTTITIPEIANRLDVCEETIYDLCKRHIIPSIRPGRRFIISRTAYEKWEATIGEKKTFDMHSTDDPGCRGAIRALWSDEYEEQLYARDELLEQAISRKIVESN
jgi:excisionase family DNA binding protein